MNYNGKTVRKQYKYVATRYLYNIEYNNICNRLGNTDKETDNKEKRNEKKNRDIWRRKEKEILTDVNKWKWQEDLGIFTLKIIGDIYIQ